MGGTSRVTISVPSELLVALDRRLARGDESRSAVIRRLLEAAVLAAQEEEDVMRFVEGYRRDPQTEEEFGWHDPINHELAKDLRWE